MTNKAILNGPNTPAKSAFPNQIGFVGPCNDPFTGKDIPAGQTESYIDTGMSLRDYFAGKALASYLLADVSTLASYEPGDKAGQTLARKCYQVADFMLAERAK